MATREPLFTRYGFLSAFLSRKRTSYSSGPQNFRSSRLRSAGRNKRLAVIRNAAVERDRTERRNARRAQRRAAERKRRKREGIFQERNLICPEVCHGTRIDSRALEPRRVSKRRRVPQSDAIEVPLLSSRHAIIERHRLCSGSFDLALFPRVSRTVRIRSADDHLQSSSFETLSLPGCNRLETIDERKFRKTTVLNGNRHSIYPKLNRFFVFNKFQESPQRTHASLKLKGRIRVYKYTSIRKEYFRQGTYSSSLFLPALLQEPSISVSICREKQVDEHRKFLLLSLPPFLSFSPSSSL